jgi:hypothetical protein
MSNIVPKNSQIIPQNRPPRFPWRLIVILAFLVPGGCTFWVVQNSLRSLISPGGSAPVVQEPSPAQTEVQETPVPQTSQESSGFLTPSPSPAESESVDPTTSPSAEPLLPLPVPTVTVTATPTPEESAVSAQNQGYFITLQQPLLLPLQQSAAAISVTFQGCPAAKGCIIILKNLGTSTQVRITEVILENRDGPVTRRQIVSENRNDNSQKKTYEVLNWQKGDVMEAVTTTTSFAKIQDLNPFYVTVKIIYYEGVWKGARTQRVIFTVQENP